MSENRAVVLAAALLAVASLGRVGALPVQPGSAPAVEATTTYTNEEYGFTLQVPAGMTPTVDFLSGYFFSNAWSAAATEDSGGKLVVEIPVFGVDRGGDATGQPYPLFFYALVRVGVSPDTAHCYDAVPKLTGGPDASDLTIQGVPFKVIPFGDAGMMKYLLGKSYRAIHGNMCYAIDQFEYGSDYVDSTMKPGLTQDQLDSYYAEAGRIARSFRFIAPIEGAGSAFAAVPAPAASAAGAPIAVPADAVRVDFEAGATSDIVTGRVGAGQLASYLVGAAADQPMLLSLDTVDRDATLSVSGVDDGAVLLDASKGRASWGAMLTVTQDFLVQVHGGARSEGFSLSVSTPARITFAPGGTSSVRSGSTPGWRAVDYVLRADAGQRLILDLTAPEGKAILGVYGFEDGQPYLRSLAEQTSFEMTLPATEDYIIQVVPKAGTIVRYRLEVRVPPASR